MNNPKAQCRIGNKGNKVRQESSTQNVIAHIWNSYIWMTVAVCFSCSFMAHPVDSAAGKKVAYMTIRMFEHSRRSIISWEAIL